MTESRKLKVFLCHSSQDKPIVRDLYQKLSTEDWIDPWLDEEKLLPGHDWDMEIEKAVEAADVVIVCLSSDSVTKEGYIQRELKFALDIALEKSEGTIFIVPLRLDDCQVPRKLRSWQYADYFPLEQKVSSYQRLLRSLKIRNAKTSAQPKLPDSKEEKVQKIIDPTNDDHTAIAANQIAQKPFDKKPITGKSKSKLFTHPMTILVSIIIAIILSGTLISAFSIFNNWAFPLSQTPTAKIFPTYTSSLNTSNLSALQGSTSNLASQVPTIKLDYCNKSDEHVCIYTFGEISGKMLITIKIKDQIVPDIYIKVSDGKLYNCSQLPEYSTRLYCTGPTIKEGTTTTISVYKIENNQLLASGVVNIPNIIPVPTPKPNKGGSYP
jgi:hypothetical protein